MKLQPDAKLRVATRGSPLATWQARETARLLRALHPALEVELVFVQSSGDRDQRSDLSRLGRTGVFTAEIDDVVLGGRADAGVHSLKDVPTSLPRGLVLASVLARGPYEDALVVARGSPGSPGSTGATLAGLPRGARVATGSVRRIALVRRARPDLEIVAIRGNVDTRLSKLAAGQADALIMACAGLERLALGEHVAEVLGPPRFLPAPGQGIVGIACRADDERTRALLESIRDASAWAQATAERALLARLHGGCNAPLGALARVDGERLRLLAVVLAHDGREALEDEISGSARDAEELAHALAERLASRGATRLIEAARQAR